MHTQDNNYKYFCQKSYLHYLSCVDQNRHASTYYMCPNMSSASWVWWQSSGILHEIHIDPLFKVKYDLRTILTSGDHTHGRAKLRTRCTLLYLASWLYMYIYVLPASSTTHCYFVQFRAYTLLTWPDKCVLSWPD
jgi:hypothetical protein